MDLPYLAGIVVFWGFAWRSLAAANVCAAACREAARERLDDVACRSFHAAASRVPHFVYALLRAEDLE